MWAACGSAGTAPERLPFDMGDVFGQICPTGALQVLQSRPEKQYLKFADRTYCTQKRSGIVAVSFRCAAAKTAAAG